MFPKDMKFTKDHEWVREEDGVYTVGITAFAAEQLGDITYVELPEVGAEMEQGDSAASVESVKAASDVYAPVGGRVCDINHDLESAPELVNQDPYEQGWFFRLEGVRPAQLKTLLDADAYEKYVGEQEH
ncbi:MAG: glycine cleavage system protein GcvH [Candidatus Hydrogenedentes bacterium]|nr:glycine cleavage system protein GcvH [Candidatus Hydrogenedentota bacterium]